jgi:hypothetical protein
LGHTQVAGAAPICERGARRILRRGATTPSPDAAANTVHDGQFSVYSFSPKKKDHYWWQQWPFLRTAERVAAQQP